MGKETSQRLGIEGVHEIKEWLEATTRFAFSYTVYDSQAMCARECADGTTKTFDLEGNTVPTPSRPARPVTVECKKYSTTGGQAEEFKQFLAVAYASTAHALRLGPDWEREFMWVTYHPFSQKKWKELPSVSFLKSCVEEHDGLLDGEAIDDNLVAKVADRIWVLVVGQKQVDVRLTKDELAAVNLALTKEGART